MKITVGFGWLGNWISCVSAKNRRVRRRTPRLSFVEALECRVVPCIDAASLVAGVPGHIHFVGGVQPPQNDHAAVQNHNDLAGGDADTEIIAAAIAGSSGIFTNASLSFSTLPNGMPILHSLAGGPTAVFIDFDGDATTATTAYSEDADSTTFNATEQTNIAEAWRQMSVYFAMFNTDVTTIQPTVPTAWDAVGNNISGGYSYVNVFPNSYARSFNQASNARTRVSGIAHEIGHNFGLWHQSNFDWLGNLTAEYSSGFDSLHGPIMGVDYAQSVHKWFIGHPNNSASTLQDDLAIISSKISAYDGSGDGFRVDDFGGTIATAAALTDDGTTQSAAGIIERMNDFDAFSFTVLSEANNTVVNATPDTPSAVDLKLEIYSANGSLVAAKDGATNNQQITLGLATGTYYALLSSHGNYGDVGTYTITVSAGSSVTPPPTYNSLPAPSDVAVAVGAGTGLIVSWTDLAGETGYRVDRSDDGVTFTTVTTTAANVTSYNDNNLAGSMRYFYRVSAVDASGVSTPSTTVSTINRPSAVTSYNYTSLDTTTIVLNWRETTGESGYRVERSADNVNWTTLATVGANVPGYTNSGLTVNSAYYYRVTPTSALGDGPSAVLQASTRLPAVTGTALDSVASNAITFHWTDIAGETNYRIERSTNGTTFTTLATIAANTTSYTDSTVTPATEYYYRVKGITSLTESLSPTVIFAASASATALPSPWLASDIGSVAGRGATDYTSATGTFKVISSGSDISGSADNFRFTYQQMDGDGSITARVASVEDTSSGADFGVMIRETLATNSNHAFVSVNPTSTTSTINLLSRSAAGGSTTTVTGPLGAAPRWVRLTRTGSTLTGETSADGTIWTTIGTATISMTGSVYIGLAADANSTTLLNTSSFTNVSVNAINNPAPTIATAAAASPGTVTSNSTALSVLGADDGGETALTYTWSASGPASVTYTANGTNAAKNTTATFTKAGAYTFLVTATDAGGKTVTSSVAVTVSQSLTSISISPATVNVEVNATKQFSATILDQFGNAMTPAPSVTWSVTSVPGTGTITSTGGLYTAPSAVGTVATVRADSGTKFNTATVTIIAALPPAAPTNLTAQKTGSAKAGFSVKLSWTDSSVNEDGFYVQYSTNGGATWQTYATVATTSKTGTGGTVNYTTGILPKGNYSFRVMAFNALSSDTLILVPSNSTNIKI